MGVPERVRGAGRTALLLVLAAVAMVAASLALRSGLPGRLRQPLWHPEAVVALTYTPAAALLLRHLPRLRVAWVVMVAGLAAALYMLALHLGPWLRLRDAPGAGAFEWLGLWLWAVDFYLLVLVLPLIFPDGRLVSRWFRPVLAAACAVPLVVCAHLTVDPGVRRVDGGVAIYPLGEIPWPISVTILATLAACLGSVVVRFRRATPDVRRQIAWVMYAGVLAMAVNVVGQAVPVPGALRNVVTAAVPVCIVIAITRYRLYDIDVVINRTLVYLGVAAVISVVYLSLVALAGAVASMSGRTAGLVGAIVAGAAFAPVRRSLQRAVDRVMHGERDPYRLADRLQRRLQTASDPGAALAGAIGLVGEALRATGVVVEVLDREGRVVTVAQEGSLGDRPRLVPLVWHGDPVGRLVFSVPRSPDARLAGIMARNLAELANATRLAADVQRSRERILRTREEERRRLRRDLHDGLGPTLASLAMAVDTARLKLRSDPEAVDALLENLRATMGRTIGDIRELVYGLRPPALDDLGLAGAIEALGGVVEAGDGPSVQVEVEGDLEALPAAAEVAAYRIVQEALTNVHRHARAGSAVVRLHLNGDLHVTVGDDGVGMPPSARSGVGMSSMRERAAELGGSCTVGPGPDGGTVVHARLPVNGSTHDG
ncbi:sensor histidine kinase [Actinomadura kijaniata]|uniref:sensor histidine kinase n=1 Tax=Actinomadura kijaniata TaxID=46161 RepID=UPI00082DB7F3|nr:sensor histidine kinase [Actinomadura kijaniata]